MLLIRWTDATNCEDNMQPTVGRIIHCWPERHDPLPESNTLVCAGIITGVFDGEIAVHYFLPNGENGSCKLPLAPVEPPAVGDNPFRAAGAGAAVPTRGAWWWPPRA